MKQIITTVSVVALLLITSGTYAQDPGSLGKPSIVLVFMDNFSWGEPGFNGDPVNATRLLSIGSIEALPPVRT